MRGRTFSQLVLPALLVLVPMMCVDPQWAAGEDANPGSAGEKSEERGQGNVFPATHGTGIGAALTPERPSTDDSIDAPNDPCLPPLYKDWRELAIHERQDNGETRFVAVRIVIERETFRLALQGIRPDGSVEDVYETHVAMGDSETPTPGGSFIINHIYCYPDVVFYDLSHAKIPALYKGFFAPLLACDDEGNCDRFRDLGMHGFNPSAYPEPDRIRPETYGAVSGGCIRVPDPCAFKTALIRLVGLGPLKRNDRGCYHWLNKPVGVQISPEDGLLASLLEGGLLGMKKGLRTLIRTFMP